MRGAQKKTVLGPDRGTHNAPEKDGGGGVQKSVSSVGPLVREPRTGDAGAVWRTCRMVHE